MPRIAFADESGTNARAKCYAIGVVSVDAAAQEAFEMHFRKLHSSHGVSGEAKWTRIRASHGLTHFTLSALDSILRSRTSSIDVMVVHKGSSRNWTSPDLTREGAFYHTYTYLLRHLTRRAMTTTHVYIDD